MESPYLDCLALFGVGGAHPGGLRLSKNILSKEKIEETTAILDVGCGTGQTSAYLAEQYKCKITSIDCNKVMLDKAKQRFQSLGLHIDVKYGNTECLPFDDNTFDIILSESVIAFTDAALTIPEFRRVLKPEGVLLAVEMVLEKTVSEEELSPLLQFYGLPQILTEHEWRHLFQKANFKNISADRYKLQFDEHDVQNAADFSLSADIDDKFFDILERHEYFTKNYKDLLGFRIFRCSV